MNIENERKEFEEAFVSNRVQFAISNGTDPEIVREQVKDSLEKGLIPAAFFELWIVAKESAERFYSKPVVKVEQKPSKSWYVYGGPNCEFHFHTIHSDLLPDLESAVRWCENRGYRVVTD